ncbi:unnamed protein product [Cladocopium goreaui]|uniref:D-xylose 1-dehydrogenase (NADP(+), D-xylono-1,5-lactone-forming) n=1 Tax=Cladocopium goreaui TaxID=2562237 RepID=A0A9P1FQM2_9DINO|nr:unnamed protein product [Cladocopium goreaui]
MRLSLVVSCLGPGLALLAAALWSIWPVILRLRRIPQVLVYPENKDKDALRIGILGASFIARAAVIHAADKRQDVLVTAVAARSESKAKSYAQQHRIPAFHGGATAYRELLAREDVDAVYVGLPTALHLEWTLAALNAGKHVLLEKPAVLSAEEAHQVVKTMRETQLLVFEAAHHRYHPAARRFKQLMTFGGDSEMASASFDVRFSMLDPPSLLNSIKDTLGLSVSLSSEDRRRERIKNLDRWWYCVDMLLWSTGAYEAEVVFAKEERFSISATLKLQLPNRSTTATLSMARDSWRDPFTWSISAGNRSSETSLRLQNFGFPFIWHRLDLIRNGQQTSEQLYGAGETTSRAQGLNTNWDTSAKLLDEDLLTRMLLFFLRPKPLI